ncbi:hypothetical protein A2U01_0004117 [Trifolium medium]|uniref:Uncharacterized protein n=1 Tax=Trifolium medium TaxID=97028 RepID=A0A392M933_9FABA|nr:hypothetical protein [Trifolium medium]
MSAINKTIPRSQPKDQTEERRSQIIPFVEALELTNAGKCKSNFHHGSIRQTCRVKTPWTNGRSLPHGTSYRRTTVIKLKPAKTGRRKAKLIMLKHPKTGTHFRQTLLRKLTSAHHLHKIEDDFTDKREQKRPRTTSKTSQLTALPNKIRNVSQQRLLHHLRTDKDSTL